MYIPGPPIQPLVAMQDIDKYLEEFEGIGNLSAGVAVYGSAAAYALVWELGSLRLQKPGPKTLWSTNRFGERVILTKQAPHGYIGVLEDQFWPIIEGELDKVSFQEDNPKRLRLKLEVALDNASHKIAAIIAEAAPKDSGDLASQIQGIDTDETSVLSDASDLEASGTMIL